MFSLAGLIAALACVVVLPQESPAPLPVVIELFTSEGCSSCPPADAVLSRLAQEQPVPGVRIIPLGLHVTYWDQLGWRDAASLSEATERQQDYGRVFGEDHIYTPQAVIDGREEIVGSDRGGIERAIAKAARRPHAHVALSIAPDSRGVPVAHVSVSDVPADVHEPLRTLIAVTEDGLTSVVKRGENGGRTLHHDAVVRRLSSSIQLTGIPPQWHRERLKIVALVQGVKSQHIVGAAIAPIQ
jgi:hypothetical protein